MSIWRCPVCAAAMQKQEKGIHCLNGHCFDAAKSGYVNLLPVQQKRTKQPGDNLQMVRARRDFLQAGYYALFQQAVCEMTVSAMPQKGILLDAGCGDGYYTAAVTEALQSSEKDVQVYGVDISKYAVDLAAKHCRAASFAVGSVFHLPVSDHCCDGLISLFAPYAGTEFQRVLKSGGVMILGIPAARHLIGLKQAIYDTPYENAVKPYALEGFSFIGKRTIETVISLPNQTTIQNLFAMTPYYYKTGQKEQARLAKLETLETEIAFELLQYQKE